MDDNRILVRLLLPRDLHTAIWHAAQEDSRNRHDEIVWMLRDYVRQRQVADADEQERDAELSARREEDA